MFKRYAVFYTAPPSPFADFCAGWLGWNSRQGVALPHPILQDLDVAALTETPRKYGFHGTLKAPFRLATDHSVDDQKTTIAAFARQAAPVILDGMAMGRHHGYLALRPVGHTAALDALAARTVADLDHFRAFATDGELARRRQADLTERQEQNLTKWGYPYVMADFQFHLTLSGRLEERLAQKVLAQLEPILSPLLPRPFPIDHITLMGQAEDGMFYEIHRYALSG